MNEKSRILIKDILIIVLFSVIFAVAYNIFSTNPLPFLREKKTVTAVTDSLLSILEGKDTTKITKLPASVSNKIDSSNRPADKLKPVNTNPEKVKPDRTAEQPQKVVQAMSYSQVVKNLNNKNFQFVDARSADEFKSGHIGNAINIFAYETDQNLYFSSITKLPTDKILVVYCDGGECDASHKLSEDIKSFGYKKVFLYEGGWEEWFAKQKSN